MRAAILALGALCFASLTSSGATAAEASLWARCDGWEAPDARTLSGPLPGVPDTPRPPAAATGQTAIAACNAALASADIDRYWARKADLLLARASHKAAAGQTPGALADLDAARAALRSPTGQPAFDRPFALNLDLLEAALTAKSGRPKVAEALAYRAAQARPWSYQAQAAAAEIFAVDPAWSETEDHVLTRAAALNPAAIVLRAESREWGRPDLAVEDWERRLGDIDRGVGTAASGPDAAELAPALYGSYVVAKAALANARVGRQDRARELLKRLKAAAAWTPTSAPANDAEAAIFTERTRVSSRTLAKAKEYQPYIEAFIALNDRDPARANRAVDAAATIPAEPAVADLFDRLSRQPIRPATFPDWASGMAAALPGQVQQMRTQDLALGRFAQGLPQPAAAQARSAYPWQTSGVRRDPAFVERPYAGLGGAVISFDKALDRGAVEEMVLLRAAELARAQQAERLLVIDRHDIEGVAVAPDPRPRFSTEAEVLFVHAGEASPGGRDDLTLDVDRVLADLGPLYMDQAAAPSRR